MQRVENIETKGEIIHHSVSPLLTLFFKNLLTAAEASNCVCMRETVNPFPHTTILQQTTLNIFCQIMENLYNWTDNLWLKVENIVTIGEIARLVQFLLLSLCFQKSRLLQRHQKASIWGKGLKNEFSNSNFPIFNFNFTSCFH